MKKVSFAVGWDAKGKPSILAVADRASEVLPAIATAPDGIVEAAVYRDPHPFKRRRFVAATPAQASAPQPPKEKTPKTRSTSAAKSK